jgi:hypothetical protein
MGKKLDSSREPERKEYKSALLDPVAIGSEIREDTSRRLEADKQDDIFESKPLPSYFEESLYFKNSSFYSVYLDRYKTGLEAPWQY